MEFPQRLKYVRNRKHVSIARAAKDIGISKTTLISYEQGHSSPKPPTFQAIADFYGVSSAWLMGFSEMDNRLFINHSGEQHTQLNYLNHNTKQPGLVLYDDLKLFYAPLLKGIQDGIDLFDTDNIEDFYYVDITFAGLKLDDTAFLYRLNSNNMAPKYSSGDLVLIQKQDKIKDGEVAILILNDEVKVNIYHHSDHYVFLESINQEYKLEKILSTSVKIIGKVIWRIGK